MRFLRFLLNTLMFFVVTIVVTFAQIGCFGLTVAQTRDVEAITIATSKDKVSYWDAYGFWGTEMKNSVTSQPKYRIRSWFSPNWWKSGMAWADYALDFSISIVKPLVVPIAQVNAVKDYYYGGEEKALEAYLTDFDGEKYVMDAALLKEYDSEEELRKEVYEYFSAYAGSENMTNAVFEVYIKDYKKDGLNYESENTRVKGEPFEFDAVNENKFSEFDASLGFKHNNYDRWVANNPELFNHIWKIEKYNDTSYEYYFNKFIEIDGDIMSGKRVIRPAVIELYTMVYVSYVIALIFVICYPVSLIQARFVGRKGKKNDAL